MVPDVLVFERGRIGMKGERFMMATEVYTYYKKMFPECASQSEEYFPNGKNSIRIRNRDRSELIFTISNGSNNWRLETLDSFLGKRKEFIK